MQESDLPRRASRPSLLSEQPPPGGSHSILSKLDDRPATGGRRPVPVRRRSGRAAGVVALLLAAGGGLAWMAAGSGPETERPLTMAAPAQAMAPPAVAALPASIPVSVPAPAPETHKSVAAILEDTPHLPKPAPAPIPASGKGDKDELLTLLDTPPKTAAKAAEKPVRAAVKVAQADKPARKEKGKEKEKARAIAAKKPPAKAAPPVDTDVALLAALLAHNKKAPAPASGKAARELKRCAALGSAAEVEQCRARVCGGEAKGAPECKPPRVAKATD